MISKRVLAFGAHPDDVEFGCSGTLILLKKLGYQINIVDLTRGEASKYGSAERIKESKEASIILEIERETFDFGDKKISLSKDHKNKVKNILKKYNPSIVFAPYFKDKHEDHINTAKLVSCLIPTIHYYISDVENPNFGADITKTYFIKLNSIYAHKSQIRPGNLEWLEERNKVSGKILGVEYGELFFIEEKSKINLPKIFRKL